MSFPPLSKVRIDSDRTVRVKIIRPRAYYSRAGIQNLELGVTAVTVTFATPTTDADWVLSSLMIKNSADSAFDVQHITAILRSAPSQGGFDILLSAPPLSASYQLHWAISELYNP